MSVPSGVSPDRFNADAESKVIIVSRLSAILADALVIAITWWFLPLDTVRQSGAVLRGKGLIDVMLRKGSAGIDGSVAYSILPVS